MRSVVFIRLIVYTILLTVTRNVWIRKLQSAASHYCETEKNKMLKKQPCKCSSFSFLFNVGGDFFNEKPKQKKDY